MSKLKKSGILLTAFVLLLSALGFLSLPPAEPRLSLANYQVEEGFDLKIVGSEALFKAPVTMDFDDRGRMWVVEMISYMPNLDGIGEEEKTGKITILEDTDGDGTIDNAKVFLDELVLPRAIAHVYGGLLYTDGPALWFVEIENDLPGKKTLVDPIYCDAGNVEHQPNGLMMNVDNWIYNANSNFRYRRVKGKWLKEPSSYRGQWGLTKDNIGRMYYNTNSSQFRGDNVLPNTVIHNRYFRPRNSVNQNLGKDQRVYPLHATSVNRGYQKGVLDKDGRLTTVTAACGPVLYRGGQFPNEYNLNAFVCVPEANLIKRNIVEFKGLETEAVQAWEGKEFIASTDEGFRPVNLFNGPDGAMYIVDMHRGIIQHKAFITQYLTKLLAKKKLDTLQNMGRILKVTNKKKAVPAIPDLSVATSAQLLEMLSSTNGWIRDRAQQILIRKKDKSIKNDLIALAKSGNNNFASIHALYVLEGTNALSFKTIVDIAENSEQEETIAHALGLLREQAKKKNAQTMHALAEQLLAKNSETVDFYLAANLNPWLQLNGSLFDPIMKGLIERYPENKIMGDAIISGIHDLEGRFATEKNSKILESNLAEVAKNKEKDDQNPIYVNVSVNEDSRTKGLKLFRTICGACHGPDGSGIEDLAPPLKESEFINGSTSRLAAIILHGISGPIHVNGKLYELNTEMPALAANSDISDQDIVDIIRYLQNAFASEGKGISVAQVKKMREMKPAGQSGLFSEKELLENNFDK
ncbi:c-type cytochrome [Marinilongibacter aquaticus]|uniref:DUF7133 domain-containing protein n=1 Tax=Marinilongibacter aquaticus TaxID=2975157 RepID=UPI0021BDD561|nr:c-type cytochrome [Marinilongibacter aquaticus]UBM58650.1 c-type cytochrome [Marinilongibacter aquaticus]